MFASFQSSSASADTATQAQATSEQDDFALGCECADPSLQIDSWGRETGEAPQSPISVG